MKEGIKMKSGIFMVDCGGLNLLAESAQTVTGLYERVKAALKTNKPVYAYNVLFGANNPMSPIGVMVNFESSDSELLICTASTLQIRITSADVVTIVNFIG